jgi:hypothetical protein
MDLTRRVWIAAAMAALALSCGSGSDEAPSPAAPGSEPATPTASSPPRSAADDPAAMARLEALYEWDLAAGTARDLKADTRTCMSQAPSQGLRGVAEHMECMRALGWKTIRPQG